VTRIIASLLPESMSIFSGMFQQASTEQSGFLSLATGGCNSGLPTGTTTVSFEGDTP